MKKLITILLLALTVISYGQTKIDMLMFNSLNDYRIEHGVEPLVFDSLVWKASQHHSVYLSENGYPYEYVCSSGHLELELVRPWDRVVKYGVKTTRVGECIVYTIRGLYGTDEDVIGRMLRNWDSSPPHKKMILDDNFTIGAVSIVETDKLVLGTLNLIIKNR